MVKLFHVSYLIEVKLELGHQEHRQDLLRKQADIRR